MHREIVLSWGGVARRRAVADDAPMTQPARSWIPHPFLLLLYGLVVATFLTWVVPAGEYARTLDAATGGERVVPGSYQVVERAPVGPMAALVAPAATSTEP